MIMPENCQFHEGEENQYPANALIVSSITLSDGKVISHKFPVCDGCALSEDARTEEMIAMTGIEEIKD